MAIKVYIGKNMYHLPQKHPGLLEKISQANLRYFIGMSKVHKFNPITKIEGNENIVIEKQATNIFLLNFLLLVLQQQKKEILKKNFYNNEFILSELEKNTQLELKGKPFEEIEELLLSFIEGNLHKNDSEGNQSTIGECVEYTTSWIRKMTKNLNRREQKNEEKT